MCELAVPALPLNDRVGLANLIAYRLCTRPERGVIRIAVVGDLDTVMKMECVGHLFQTIAETEQSRATAETVQVIGNSVDITNAVVRDVIERESHYLAHCWRHTVQNAL
jgi:hypothetical protein